MCTVFFIAKEIDVLIVFPPTKIIEYIDNDDNFNEVIKKDVDQYLSNEKTIIGQKKTEDFGYFNKKVNNDIYPLFDVGNQSLNQNRVF